MTDITIYYRDKIDKEKVLLDTKAEMLVYARDKNASEIIQAGSALELIQIYLQQDPLHRKI